MIILVKFATVANFKAFKASIIAKVSPISGDWQGRVFMHPSTRTALESLHMTTIVAFPRFSGQEASVFNLRNPCGGRD